MTAKVSKGVPNSVYQAWPELSTSKLQGFFEGTPADVKWKMDNPEEVGIDHNFHFGTAFHTRVLEPDLWDKDIAVLPTAEQADPEKQRKTFWSTNDGKEYKAQWLEDNKDKALITSGVQEKVNNMALAVMADENAGQLLSMPGDTELSIQFEYCGVPFRARLDRVIHDLKIVIDIKSSADASPANFSKSMWKYGYVRAFGSYSAACEAAFGWIPEQMIFIVVEKEGPWKVQVYTPKPHLRELGNRLNNMAIQKYMTCMETDTWPGYSTKIETIDIPPWAYKEALGLGEAFVRSQPEYTEEELEELFAGTDPVDEDETKGEE